MIDERFNYLLSAPLGESRRKCVCASERTAANKAQQTLSVNNLGDRVTYHCWHCGAKGAVRRDPNTITKFEPRKREPAPVRKDELMPLTAEAIAYLEFRLISRQTAEWAGLRSTTIMNKPAIAYRYPSGWYKVKSLAKDERGKRLQKCLGAVKDELYLQDLIGTLPALDSSDSEEVLKGLSFRAAIKNNGGGFENLPLDLTEIGSATTGSASPDYTGILTITEGEEDALSCIEARILNSTSIPHGAINAEHEARPDNAKLAFVSAQPDFWRQWRRVNIATDADGNGRAMLSELARRLGRWRSFLVNFPDGCKDSNDVLVRLGAEELVNVITNAEPSSVPGLYTASSFHADLVRLRRGELGRGESTGFPSLDPYFKVAPGITVVTGYPKHGKSDFVDQVNINLAERLGWSTVVWSPENPGSVHTAKLMEKRARARFFPEMPNQMSQAALEEAEGFVERYFKFVRPSGPATIEAILELFSAAVARLGCRNAVIDPYNAISRPLGAREDEYIMDMLNKCREWVNDHEAHLFFVAHPRTDQQQGNNSKGPKSTKIVTGHNISGGITWYAKCDFGLTIARKDLSTEAHVWAVKHSHLGQDGMAELQYDYRTATFEDRDSLFTERPSPRLVVSNDTVPADFDEFDY